MDHNMKNIKFSLQTKIILSIVAVTSLMIFVFGAFVIRMEKEHSKNLLQWKGKMVSKRIAGGVEMALHTANDSVLKEEMNEFLSSEEDIVSVKIEDKKGKLIFEKTKNESLKETLPISTPLVFQGYSVSCQRCHSSDKSDLVKKWFQEETIGTLKIGFSTIQEKKRIETLVQTITLIMFGTVLILVFVITFSMRKLVLFPIFEINKTARAIASGELNRRVPVTTNDEIGSLTIVFNGMVNSLEKTQNLLHTANSKLMELLRMVERSGNLQIRFENPHLRKCWEIKKCDYKDCPAYGSENLRCWQIVGTHCQGIVQGIFAKKIEYCEKCELYRYATPDKIFETGEIFNNMMLILEQKAGDLEKAKESIENYNKTLESQVEQRTEELKEMHTHLVQSEKLSAIGQFAAGVAHEINNPLGVILGFSHSIVRRIKADDPFVMPLKSIEREAVRCKDLIQDLLTFSRIDKAEKTECDLNEVIDGTLSLIVAQARYNSVEVSVDYGKELPKIFVNRNRVQQMVINLCSNAIDAMPNGGVLTLRTAGLVSADKPSPFTILAGRQGLRIQNEKYVEISVTDTGTGIPDEIKNKIFEPFFTTKEVGKGTGLGLSLVYEIVQKHEGIIGFESQIGKGTKFSIFLPLNLKSVSSVRQKKRILIADDETDILQMIEKGLSDENYDLAFAEDGFKLGKLLSDQTPHLIVLDIFLPGIDGLKICEMVRSDKKLKDVRILAISGKKIPKDQVICAGADDFVEKPFDVNSLKEKIVELLGKNAG